MSTERLAQFVAETSYEQIPEQGIALAKKAILDGIGVSLAGSKEPTGRIITEYVKELDGKPECGVIAGGFRTNAPQAALANGTMCHALDYDDGAVSGWGHPTSVLMPTLMALGERNKSSGRDILEAYVIGWEIGFRLCAATAAKFVLKGWHPTATIGTMACAAAAAKLLKLDACHVRMALGIAASEAGGLMRNFGTDVKPFHAGKAACLGIMAARLAQKGFTAYDSIIEAPGGFLSVFVDGGELNKLTEGLGSTFDILTSAQIKAYPACGGAHKCIDAILYLVREYDIHPEDVAEVETHVPAVTADSLFYHHPQTGLQGKFSMQYCVAAGILDHEVSLRQFTDEKVQDARVQDLVSRVRYVFRDALPENRHWVPHGVKVKLASGKEYFYDVLYNRGHPKNPLTWDEVVDKVGSCARSVIPTRDVKRIVDLVSNLQNLTDVTELMSVASKIGPKRSAKRIA